MFYLFCSVVKNSFFLNLKDVDQSVNSYFQVRRNELSGMAISYYALEAEGLDIVEKPNPVTLEWKKSDAKARRVTVDRISSEQLELVMLDLMRYIFKKIPQSVYVQNENSYRLIFNEKEEATTHLA